jgi:seryl-tRNA synthetase
MLDIRLIRENPDAIKDRLRLRGGEWHLLVDNVLQCDARRRAVETQLQHLQSERKRVSKEIGMRKSKGEDTAAVEASVRGMGDEIQKLNEDATALDQEQRDLLLHLPNLPHTDAPVGEDAAANPVIRVWGTKPEFGFSPKSHIDLGAQHAMFDFERGAKVTGSAFVVFTGPGARLERALIQFLLDIQTRENGYLEVNPPFLVSPESLVGTSQLPKFEEQLYRCDRDNLYLAPTAEVPVTNLHRDEILKLEQLPIKYAAYTPCFRREAGSAGLGTRGLIRMHQFDKVELVKICVPETSYAELESLTADAEKILQLLGLHYQVIELCTGDIGFGSAKTYDIEVWAPGQGGYLEVSSCSNFEDYQARRMALRYRDAEGKNRVCHTLNGSGTALPRLMVALMETHQREDGTIHIPPPLQPYYGAATIG